MERIIFQTALEKFKNEALTLCLFDGNDWVISKERGVAPLIGLLEKGFDGNNYYAVDKVVGMGAAYLYSKLGVKFVHAQVMSQGAKNVAERLGVPCSAEKTVPYIINRKGDGICPVESVLKDDLSANDAIEIIKKRLKELKNNKQSEK